MKNKYTFVCVMLCVILVLSYGFTSIYLNAQKQEKTEDKIQIVTSFYPMYIICLNLTDGVENVELSNLSEPKTGCLHDFQLTPSDMKLLSQSDVFVINGGGIESFISDVADSYPELEIVTATEDVVFLEEDEHEEGGNAHAWMSVCSYRQMVSHIKDELCRIDPKNAAKYNRNFKEYDKKLAGLEEEFESLAKETSGENVIIFHEAYEYVACEMDMNVCYTLDLDEERAVSAGEISEVISSIDENNVSVILAEELYGKKVASTVSSEKNVKVVYIDPLNKGDYDKDSYVEGMTENINKLREAYGIK